MAEQQRLQALRDELAELLPKINVWEARALGNEPGAAGMYANLLNKEAQLSGEIAREERQVLRKPELALVVVLAVPRLQAVQRRLTRKLKYAIINKSSTEMSALRACGVEYFVCLFHVLQAWERFLRSADGGVKEKGDRKAIVAAINELARTADKAVFTQREAAFTTKWAQAHKAVVDYYCEHWADCADWWSFYGRTAVAAMDVNTNNHLERWNGTLKYVFLLKKKMRQLALLLSTLIKSVMPHCIYDRQKKLAGLESSGTVQPHADSRTCSLRSSWPQLPKCIRWLRSVTPSGSLCCITWSEIAHKVELSSAVGDVRCDCGTDAHSCEPVLQFGITFIDDFVAYSSYTFTYNLFQYSSVKAERNRAVCPIAATMSALERHEHQVRFIHSKGFVKPSVVHCDNMEGFFICKSAKDKNKIYSGCIGELHCTCPQAQRAACKHLEAAAMVLPFTHAASAKAAAALVDHLVVKDLESGVVERRQVK
ncbi:hypothetical protein JKP88DRAFT_255926 [Tribonema minus]|uniref:SWIM-type domain-containing protein n=1 Tax=Tribonema minus TaxID=303371 RepID=A0A836CE80_9STRA|nr:hypothetical protein JKP88DRAFT_255926 [Tribonema minus]